MSSPSIRHHPSLAVPAETQHPSPSSTELSSQRPHWFGTQLPLSSREAIPFNTTSSNHHTFPPILSPQSRPKIHRPNALRLRKAHGKDIVLHEMGALRTRMTRRRYSPRQSLNSAFHSSIINLSIRLDVSLAQLETPHNSQRLLQISTMAEAVGLALSVLPIVIWALEKYSEPLEAYTGYHNAISTLQANLQIQRMHLEATFQSIGLRHPTPRELHECLRQKFPQNHREVLFIIRQMDDMMMKLMENLQVDMSRKPLWTHESSERASWEWRRVKRSFRAKKCDKVIHDLRNWNDDLRHLIESAATLPHDESYAMRRVRRLYNRSNCESVRNTLRALHRALQAGLDSDGAKSHQVCIELNSLHAGGIPLSTFRIGILHELDDTRTAPWRVFYAAGEATKRTTGLDSPPMSPHSLRSRPSTLRSRRSSYSQGLREMAHSIWSKSRDSFKQLPTPRASVEDTSIIPSISEIIAPSPPPITNLCNDFDSSPHEDVFGSLKDPTPPSSHEQTLFSLSHVSRNHDTILKDISLEKIIATESQRVAPAIQPLSAKRRYGIAASLAWAVLYLSGSPWLSHGLDRRKVKLFLQRKQANGYISLSEKVYLSCVISKTSFPSPASSSTSLAQTTPKNLIFELGILLIELAVNQSFSQESLSAILQHDYRPLKHYLDRVELEAGIYYFNAAQRCVYSVFLADQEQMDFDLDKFQHEFYSTVVAPLQATYEAR